MVAIPKTMLVQILLRIKIVKSDISWAFTSETYYHVTILNVFLGHYFVKTKDGKQYLIETKEVTGGEGIGGHGYGGKGFAQLS